MAGVASGLALATTLMAMQVADTMSTHHAGYRVVVDHDHGFLGIRYHFKDHHVVVDRVLPRTPADAVGMRAGDLVLAIDGDEILSQGGIEAHIFGVLPGSQPILRIERAGKQHSLRPTLTSWPVAISY